MSAAIEEAGVLYMTVASGLAQLRQDAREAIGGYLSSASPSARKTTGGAAKAATNALGFLSTAHYLIALFILMRNRTLLAREGSFQKQRVMTKLFTSPASFVPRDLKPCISGLHALNCCFKNACVLFYL
jgi:hypothetical protein